MISRPILLILLGILLANRYGQAQVGSDSLTLFLQAYARPDFNRVALDFRPSLNGSTSAKETVFGNDYINVGTTVSYRRIRNTRRYQQWLSASINPFYAKTEGVDAQFTVSPVVNSQLRYFFDERKYLAAYNSASGNIGFGKLDPDLFSSQNDFGIGFGRVEVVSDAIHASRIFDMLRCAGVLSGDLKMSDLTTITDTIATLKNQRFFDGRLQRIREMEIVASILSDMGYIDLGDFFTQAIFSDAYDFEVPFFNFQSGSSLELLLGRDFAIAGDDWLSADDLRLTARWTKHKVKGKFYATDLNIGSSLAYRRAEAVGGGQNRYISRTTLGVTQYYAPTNRILMYLESGLIGRYDMRRRASVTDIDSWSVFVNSTGNISYYFSPQLRLSGFIRLQTVTYGDTSRSAEHDGTLTFAISMLYSYF